MAVSVIGRRLRATVPVIGKTNLPILTVARLLSTSRICRNNEGFLSKLGVRTMEQTKQPHSRMLSDKKAIYALYTHNIRPDSIDKYFANYQEHVNLIHSKKNELQCELVGSWTVEVGDLDQALHLWQYNGSFERVDKAQLVLSKDESYQRLLRERGNFLRSRHLQYVYPFSYWPEAVKREGPNIYEIRSYRLKPGTMIEWANNWARGITYRRNNDEPFAGFFSQIGRLYNVHHIWCYKDLQSRTETRESAWRSPGWDECVSYTVPLIREMHSRILKPTSFSPTQ
ncbi:protein NipSnap [Chelonus insularis]|uniref:protein NipSnap n=1 Tax=Chelonus insularis TaxID=460826 RepID=UPI00158DD77B|nr:protein NipSnap [Chelonus insularis]